jgi:hypothetical protein
VEVHFGRFITSKASLEHTRALQRREDNRIGVRVRQNAKKMVERFELTLPPPTIELLLRTLSITTGWFVNTSSVILSSPHKNKNQNRKWERRLAAFLSRLLSISPTHSRDAAAAKRKTRENIFIQEKLYFIFFEVVSHSIDCSNHHN